MCPTPESDGRDPTLTPLTGPPIVDMTARIEESRRRHEAELAAAQKLVAEARAGTAPTPPKQIDGRGEAASYVEHDRRVWLECIYWGGPAGSVAHVSGVWEYTDGRRKHLTTEERALVLRRVIEHAKKHDDIKLEVERG